MSSWKVLSPTIKSDLEKVRGYNDWNIIIIANIKKKKMLQ